MAEPYPHFLPDLVQEIEDCTYSKRGPMIPSSLRRYFLLLIRGHWSDAHNFGPDLEDTLKCLTWNPDPQDRGVEIELSGGERPDNTTHMIWVSLGNFNFRQVSFGLRGDDFEEDNATERYVMPTSCQLLIRHEAPTTDQAFDMAWTTHCFLMGFTEAIRYGLGPATASFKPEILGEPQMKQPAPIGRIRVDVGARLDINLAVATTVESHRLKMVALTPTPQLQ